MAKKENLIRIFEYALSQEEAGKSFFEASLKRMGWGAAVDVFKQLITEEEKHIEFISHILENLKAGGADTLKIGKDLVGGKSAFFDMDAKGDFMQQMMYESMVPDVTAFSMAWLIEKDLSEYYEQMAARTDGEVKKALTMLADWEKGHERFFREYRQKLTEMYANMPWGG